jgi:phosphoglycerol transferase MdoB-like AlkP superfamily enzyme
VALLIPVTHLFQNHFIGKISLVRSTLLDVAIYILGSLYYGEKVLELNPLPANISLVSILKANDYTTSFYSGDDSSFDRKNKFFSTMKSIM